MITNCLALGIYTKRYVHFRIHFTLHANYSWLRASIIAWSIFFLSLFRIFHILLATQMSWGRFNWQHHVMWYTFMVFF